MATRRKFSAEYKHEAFDLGIDLNMISRWCRELESSPKKAFPEPDNTRNGN